MRTSRRFAAVLLPLTLIAFNLLAAPAAYAQIQPPKVRAALATTTSIRLQVDSARDRISKVRGAHKSGTPITTYKWLLNLDNTGNPGQ